MHYGNISSVPSALLKSQIFSCIEKGKRRQNEAVFKLRPVLLV